MCGFLGTITIYSVFNVPLDPSKNLIFSRLFFFFSFMMIINFGMATFKTFILTHAHNTSISMPTRFKLNFFSLPPAHWLKCFTYLHIHIRLNALFILQTSYDFDLWLHFNLINFVNINFLSPLLHGRRSPFQFYSFFRC